MTPVLLAELSRLPLFPRSAANLIRVAGLEGAAAIIKAWGGQEWPVPVRVGGARPAGRRRYAALVEIVGDEVAQRIVREYGGTMLDVPNLKEALWSRNKDRIRARFDELSRQGYSFPEAVFELGLEYGVTGRTIQNVLSQPDNEQAPPQLELL